MFKQLAIRSLIFLTLPMLLAGCSSGSNGALPTLMPTAAVGVLDKAPVNEVAEIEVPPINVPAQVTLENGVTVTADPAQFATYESQILGVRLQHPPEMQNSPPQSEENGLLNFLVNGDLSIDSTSDSYEGTGMGVLVFDKAQYGSLPNVNVDDLASVMQLSVIDQYGANGVEVIQPITSTTVNGRNAVSALIHLVPFPGGSLQRSAYIVVISEGDRIITFKGDTSLADEAVMLPIFDTMVNSLELP